MDALLQNIYLVNYYTLMKPAESRVKDWPSIPQEAFLYFPKGCTLFIQAMRLKKDLEATPLEEYSRRDRNTNQPN